VFIALPLGFVGAAIWVPLSICGILAIYNLGLAVPTAVGYALPLRYDPLNRTPTSKLTALFAVKSIHSNTK